MLLLKLKTFTLLGQPLIPLKALDLKSLLTLALGATRCGPSLWNPVPENPFRGMPIMTGEAWTSFTVQHCGLVRQDHSLSLIFVKNRAMFGMYSPYNEKLFKLGAKNSTPQSSVLG